MILAIHTQQQTGGVMRVANNLCAWHEWGHEHWHLFFIAFTMRCSSNSISVVGVVDLCVAENVTIKNAQRMLPSKTPSKKIC